MLLVVFNEYSDAKPKGNMISEEEEEEEEVLLFVFIDTEPKGYMISPYIGRYCGCCLPERPIGYLSYCNSH